MLINNRLDIHFLNVDHGDCTIIAHPTVENNKDGQITIVDVNDWKNRKIDSYANAVAGLDPFQEYSDGYIETSELVTNYVDPETYAEKYLDDPIEYYQDMYSKQSYSTWRFILTHPDLDHLSGIERIQDEIDFSYFWDTENDKILDSVSDFGPRFDSDDWDRYQDIRNDDTNANVISPKRGESGSFWDDDNIEIVHPTSEFENYVNDQNEDRNDDEQNFNDISYVLKISIGNQAVLLCGDVLTDAWDDIIDEKGLDYFRDVTVLKASHHGRKSGFHHDVVEAMDPDYVVLSVGAKPDTDAQQKYKNVCRDDTEIYSTRQYGTIRARCTRRKAELDCSVPDGIF